MAVAKSSRPQLKIRRINLDTGRENVVVISSRSKALRAEVFRGFGRVELRAGTKSLLATLLLTEGGDEWTPEKIKATLASGKSVQASFPKPLPVYIVYMSSAALVDGKIIDYPDVYKRDGKVIAALLDVKGKMPATPDRKVASK